MTPLFSDAQIDLLRRINGVAATVGVAVYLVGGVVRDLVRGHPVGEKDFDFMVVGDAISFAHRCVESTGGAVKEFADFRTAKIVAPTAAAGLAELDFASSRSEVYTRPGALPVVSPGDLAADLARRDFTVNALALPIGAVAATCSAPAELRRFVVDHHGGLDDLDRGVLRILHSRSFSDDPTRIFRGCRYAARLGGGFEENTAQALRAALTGGALGTISGFRITTELKKIVAEMDFVDVFQNLGRYGVTAALGIGADTVSGMLTRLQALGLPPARLFEVVARILFLSAGEGAAERFRHLGYGKKQIHHLEFDTRAGQEALSSNHLTVPGLWFLLVSGVGEEGEIRRILRSRGEDV